MAAAAIVPNLADNLLNTGLGNVLSGAAIGPQSFDLNAGKFGKVTLENEHDFTDLKDVTYCNNYDGATEAHSYAANELIRDTNVKANAIFNFASLNTFSATCNSEVPYVTSEFRNINCKDELDGVGPIYKTVIRGQDSVFFTILWAETSPTSSHILGFMRRSACGLEKTNTDPKTQQTLATALQQTLNIVCPKTDQPPAKNANEAYGRVATVKQLELWVSSKAGQFAGYADKATKQAAKGFLNVLRDKLSPPENARLAESNTYTLTQKQTIADNTETNLKWFLKGLPSWAQTGFKTIEQAWMGKPSSVTNLIEPPKIAPAANAAPLLVPVVLPFLNSDAANAVNQISRLNFPPVQTPIIGPISRPDLAPNWPRVEPKVSGFEVPPNTIGYSDTTCSVILKTGKTVGQNTTYTVDASLGTWTRQFKSINENATVQPKAANSEQTNEPAKPNSSTNESRDETEGPERFEDNPAKNNTSEAPDAQPKPSSTTNETEGIESEPAKNNTSEAPDAQPKPSSTTNETEGIESEPAKNDSSSLDRSGPQQGTSSNSSFYTDIPEAVLSKMKTYKNEAAVYFDFYHELIGRWYANTTYNGINEEFENLCYNFWNRKEDAVLDDFTRECGTDYYTAYKEYVAPTRASNKARTEIGFWLEGQLIKYRRNKRSTAYEANERSLPLNYTQFEKYDNIIEAIESFIKYFPSSDNGGNILSNVTIVDDTTIAVSNSTCDAMILMAVLYVSYIYGRFMQNTNWFENVQILRSGIEKKVPDVASIEVHPVYPSYFAKGMGLARCDSTHLNIVKLWTSLQDVLQSPYFGCTPDIVKEYIRKIRQEKRIELSTADLLAGLGTDKQKRSIPAAVFASYANRMLSAEQASALALAVLWTRKVTANMPV
jgi:hypothetical protein